MNKFTVNKRNTIILAIIIFVIFTSTIFSWKKDEIYKPEIVYLSEYYYSFYNSWEEYYLIKNCPSNLNKIKELVDDYNERNPIKKVSNSIYNISEINRNFLRESSYTKESKIKDLQDHLPQDGVASVVYDTINYNIIRAYYVKKHRNGKIIDEIKIGYD